MAQPQVYALLQSAAAFVMTASFAGLILALTKYRDDLARFRWIPPVLLCVSLAAAGVLFVLPAE